MARKLTEQERNNIDILVDMLHDALPANQRYLCAGIASALVRVPQDEISSEDIEHILGKYGEDALGLSGAVKASVLDPVEGHDGFFTLRVATEDAEAGDARDQRADDGGANAVEGHEPNGQDSDAEKNASTNGDDQDQHGRNRSASTDEPEDARPSQTKRARRSRGKGSNALKNDARQGDARQGATQPNEAAKAEDGSADDKPADTPEQPEAGESTEEAPEPEPGQPNQKTGRSRAGRPRRHRTAAKREGAPAETDAEEQTAPEGSAHADAEGSSHDEAPETAHDARNSSEHGKETAGRRRAKRRARGSRQKDASPEEPDGSNGQSLAAASSERGASRVSEDDGPAESTTADGGASSDEVQAAEFAGQVVEANRSAQAAGSDKVSHAAEAQGASKASTSDQPNDAVRADGSAKPSGTQRGESKRGGKTEKSRGNSEQHGRGERNGTGKKPGKGQDKGEGKGSHGSSRDLKKIPYIRRGGESEAEIRQKIVSLDQRFWMNGWLLSHPGAYTLYERELTAISDALKGGMLPGDITRRQLAYQIGGDEKFFEYGSDGFKLLRAMGMEDLVRHRPMPKPDLLFHAPRRRKHMRVLVTENLDPWLDVRNLMYEEGRSTILGERIHAVVMGGGMPVLEQNRLSTLLDSLGADTVTVLYWGDIDRAGIDIMLRLKELLGDAYKFRAFMPAYQLMVQKAMERYPDPLDNEVTGQVNIEAPDISIISKGLSDDEIAYVQAVIDNCGLIPQEILTRRDL